MTRQPHLSPGARDRLALVDKVLHRAYGAPESTLANHSDPLDEAIYIILSFQTDVPRARAMWLRLRAKYPAWSQLERAPLREVAGTLREGGLHRQKARTIKQLLRSVRELDPSLSLDFLHSLSDEEAERVLTRLPGLSWKGARCVLLYSLHRPVLPVDSNTFRILQRIGVLRTDAVYRRRELHDALQRLVPPTRRRRLHVNLVVHGQQTCRSPQPTCSVCPLRSHCPQRGIRKARHELVTRGKQRVLRPQLS